VSYSNRKKLIFYIMKIHNNKLCVLNSFLPTFSLLFFLPSFSSFIRSLFVSSFLTSFLSCGIVVCQWNASLYLILQYSSVTYYSINVPYPYNTASDVSEILDKQQIITALVVSWGFNLENVTIFMNWSLILLWYVCWKPEKHSLLGNGCVTHNSGVIVGILLGQMFAVVSVPRLYNEGLQSLQEGPETPVRRAGGWCEMAASLGGREPCSRKTSTVGRCYHAAQWRRRLITLVFVW
jgi:hypothetical protein